MYVTTVSPMSCQVNKNAPILCDTFGDKRREGIKRIPPSDFLFVMAEWNGVPVSVWTASLMTAVLTGNLLNMFSEFLNSVTLEVGCVYVAKTQNIF